MPLFQQGTSLGKPVGSEIQMETLPEIYPPKGVIETQAAYDARVTAWNARTRTITYITAAGAKQTTTATDATIQTAMEALAGIGVGNIKVSGAGRSFEFAFTGTLANKGMKRMYHTIAGSNIVSYFETIVAGYSQAVQRALKSSDTDAAFTAAFGVSPQAGIEGQGAPKPADIGDPNRYAGTGRQYVSTITATGGTRTLTVNGQTTTALAFNAPPATVQAALEALNNVAPGDVVVSGTAANLTYDFMGVFLGPNKVTMTVDPALLTGGTATLTLTKEGTIPAPKYR